MTGYNSILATAKHKLNWRTMRDVARALELEKTFIDALTSASGSQQLLLYRFKLHEDDKGKIRELHVALGHLRQFLVRLNKKLSMVKLPEYMHGSICGRSDLTHARVHYSRKFVTTCDIRDFFPSITTRMVKGAFRALGCTPAVATDLSTIVTVNGFLPHGFNTSSAIANLVLLPTAERVNSLANSRNLAFSCYLDDMAISSDFDHGNLEPILSTIFGSAQLYLKDSKFRKYGPMQEKVITGVRVDSGRNVPTHFLEKVRDSIANIQSVPSIYEMSRLEGQVARVIQLNRGAGKQLRKRLKLVLLYQ
jgi:hypothetical protein